jgi:NAD(P)H-hydrate epimerase
MAALAAQRAGAGYVTVAGPASLELAFASRLLEAMFAPLAETDGHLGPAALDETLARCQRATAVVLGPGIGRLDPTRGVVRDLVERLEAPLVLDADGLNALAGDFAQPLRARRAPTVLTPHAGELGRLLGVPSAEVDRARLGHARQAAAEAEAIVVLKGDDTVVALPDGRVAVSAGGAPGLATAGTGDVLAGAIGALLARGAAPVHAVCAAVHGHVCAGRLAGREHGADHVIASDVIGALPRALRP